jgi:uncharacterized membrane protein YeaQ/YmgE (transglycosylase-associated protein family)
MACITHFKQLIKENYMIMNVLAWIIFGALAGWIASIVMRTNAEQGALMNILIGIAGAVVGGFVMRAIGGPSVTGFNLSSLLVAILGAIALLGLYKAATRRST